MDKDTLPPLPPISEESREFLHYNPNTDDLADFVRAYATIYGAECARQAIAEHEANRVQGVPEGWVLVPKEPTLKMGWAYLDAARESDPANGHTFNWAGYRAALSVAPKAPQAEPMRELSQAEHAVMRAALLDSCELVAHGMLATQPPTHQADPPLRKVGAGDGDTYVVPARAYQNLEKSQHRMQGVLGSLTPVQSQPPTQQASEPVAPVHEGPTESAEKSSLSTLAKSVIKAREVYGWSIEADEAIMKMERALLAPPQPVTQRDERAAFEAWADDQGFPLKNTGYGDEPVYLDNRTESAWGGWQARAALSLKDDSK